MSLRIWCLFLLAATLPAQQTIFDVPSADVSARGGWFYQHQTVARAWRGERHWVQTNAFGYGLGHDLEVDATWFNLRTVDPGESAPSFGYKWSPGLTPESAKIPLRFVAGQMIQTGRRRGSWTYLMLNAEVPRSRTHLTAGMSAGTPTLFGERALGVLAGVEQPLSKRWMLQADWFSGRHELAYLIPGVVYHVTRRWMVSLGYQIPNRRTPSTFQAVVFELTRAGQ